MAADKGKTKATDRQTQNRRLLDYMKRKGCITQFESIIDLGILRLSARIYDLRKAGHPIDDRWIVVRNRFGEDCRVKQYCLMEGDDGREEA